MLFFQNYIIFTQCTHYPDKFLKTLNYKGVTKKYSPEIEILKVQLIFDSTADYYSNIKNPQFKIFKHLDVKNGVLCNFDKKNLYSHWNFLLKDIENHPVSLQLTHNPINGFYKFSNTDLTGLNKTQYISEHLRIYKVLPKLYLNYNALDLNSLLSKYQNYAEFTPKLKYSKDAEFFLSEQKNKIIKAFNKSIFKKNKNN